ncbi:MAG: DNA/RNA non-specific endonuclease [Saprospiraceae bacterium]
MVQLRRNHSSNRGLQTTFRMVVFIILLFLVLAGGYIYIKKNINLSFAPKPNAIDTAFDLGRTYLPTCDGILIHHSKFSLCYDEKREVSSWVAYFLDRQSLNKPNFPRSGYFTPDPDVPTRSATHGDYSGSGYTRGHLVPVGDVSYDTLAMRESFYMSNITPQTRGFNNGVWKELEENVRDWTYTCDGLYIMSGPIFSGHTKNIGKNEVSVPSAFYKVLLQYNEKGSKGIGFIIPHEVSNQPLQSYVVSIDSVETITKIDFFNNLLPDDKEESLESSYQLSKWKISDARFRLRVTKWNFE